MIQPKSRVKSKVQLDKVPQQNDTLTNLIVPGRNETHLTDHAETTDRSGLIDPPLVPIFLQKNSTQKEKVKKKIDHHIAKLKKITSDKERQGHKRSIKRMSTSRDSL